jgi:predicted helicase
MHQLHTAAVVQQEASLSIQHIQPHIKPQWLSSRQQHMLGWQQLAACKQQHLSWHLQSTATAGLSTSRHTCSEEDLRVV